MAPVAQQDLIFHVDATGIISYWASQSPDETKDQQYLLNSITVNGDTVRVNPNLSILSAIAYQYNNVDQVNDNAP